VSAPAKDHLSDVRADVLVSLGYTKEQNMEARVAVTKTLPHDLSSIELDALLRFLTEHRPATIAEGAHAYFFHELCNKLHHFTNIRALYAAALSEVAGDAKHDAITRDYAIQHLRRIWDKSPDDQAIRQNVQASFWQLAAGDSTISASAMLSLHNLGVTESPAADYAQAPVATTDFQPFLDSVLRQPPTASTIPQRMTAVRIAGDRKVNSTSELLLAIVESDSEHMLVRTSAINALGKLGMKEQLVSLSTNLTTNPRLAAAFAHATR
jgi:hypothetical protein